MSKYADEMHKVEAKIASFNSLPDTIENRVKQRLLIAQGRVMQANYGGQDTAEWNIVIALRRILGLDTNNWNKDMPSNIEE